MPFYLESLATHLFLIGLMGSGKSFYGKRLAAEAGMPFYDLDARVQQTHGHTVSAIFDLFGEPVFRQWESEALHQLANLPPAVIACGGGTPCFYDNMDLMLSLGVVVWLQPPLQVLAQRLWNERSSRPLIAETDSLEALTERLSRLQQDRSAWYSRAHICVSEPESSVEDMARSVQNFIIAKHKKETL